MLSQLELIAFSLFTWKDSLLRHPNMYVVYNECSSNETLLGGGNYLQIIISIILQHKKVS
jgi:hypothetical protein